MYSPMDIKCAFLRESTMFKTNWINFQNKKWKRKNTKSSRFCLLQMATPTNLFEQISQLNGRSPIERYGNTRMMNTHVSNGNEQQHER